MQCKQTTDVYSVRPLDLFQLILAFIPEQMSKGYYMRKLVEITVLRYCLINNITVKAPSTLHNGVLRETYLITLQ